MDVCRCNSHPKATIARFSDQNLNEALRKFNAWKNIEKKGLLQRVRERMSQKAKARVEQHEIQTTYITEPKRLLEELRMNCIKKYWHFGRPTEFGYSKLKLTRFSCLSGYARLVCALPLVFFTMTPVQIPFKPISCSPVGWEISANITCLTSRVLTATNWLCPKPSPSLREIASHDFTLHTVWWKRC